MQTRSGAASRSSPYRAVAIGATGTAAALAAAALFARHRSREAERRTPPIGRFVEVDGVRLHYTDQGEGPDIVLLHGNGSMVQDWQISGLPRALAAGHRVIAIDRPGFGYSARPRDRVWSPEDQAALFASAFRTLQVDRPLVVGHSWGTLVALALAIEGAVPLRALVLLSGYYFPTARPDAAIMSAPAVPIAGDLARFTISPLLGRLFAPQVIRKLFAPAPVPAAFGAFPVELALRPSQIRASAEEAALLAPAAERLSRRYGGLTLPVTIVTGTGDRIVDPRRHAIPLHAEIAGSELIEVTGAGHMVHHLAQRAILAAVERRIRPVPSVRRA